LSIIQAPPSGNHTFQGQGQIELYSGNVIWKRYFPGTRSKISLTLAMPSETPTSQGPSLLPRSKLSITQALAYAVYGNTTSQEQGYN